MMNFDGCRKESNEGEEKAMEVMRRRGEMEVSERRVDEKGKQGRNERRVQDKPIQEPEPQSFPTLQPVGAAVPSTSAL